MKGGEILAANPNVFNRYYLFYLINKAAENEQDKLHNIAREFIITVAFDLTQVVRQLDKMLKEIGIDEYTHCIKKIVLTGTVGEHFGRTKDDLLLTTMKEWCLGTLVETVKRSEITIASVREIEGFRKFQELKNQHNK